MKKLIVLILVISSLNAVNAQAVTVKDKYKNYQVQREEFIRWNKFKPRWMFWRIFPKHWRYKKKGGDKRNIIRYFAINQLLTMNEEASERSKDSINEMWKDAEMTNLDRIINKRWNLVYKSRFDEKDIKFYNLMNELTELGINEETSTLLLDEVLNIHADIEIINDSYENDAEKGKNYSGLLVKYDEILGNMVKLKKYYRSKKNIDLINTIE